MSFDSSNSFCIHALLMMEKFENDIGNLTLKPRDIMRIKLIAS